MKARTLGGLPARFEEYPDLKGGKVKLDGDNVVTFPKLPEMQQVTLKVLRWEERDKRLVVKDAEMVMPTFSIHLERLMTAAPGFECVFAFNDFESHPYAPEFPVPNFITCSSGGTHL